MLSIMQKDNLRRKRGKQVSDAVIIWGCPKEPLLFRVVTTLALCANRNTFVKNKQRYQLSLAYNLLKQGAKDRKRKNSQSPSYWRLAIFLTFTASNLLRKTGSQFV